MIEPAAQLDGPVADRSALRSASAADAAILVALAAATGLGLFYCVPLMWGNREAPPTPAVAAQAPAAKPTTFTYVEFAQIERGMTLDDVTRLLGGPGGEQIATRANGMAVSQRLWTNQNGATATVIFADGRVVATFQRGF